MLSPPLLQADETARSVQGTEFRCRRRVLFCKINVRPCTYRFFQKTMILNHMPKFAKCADCTFSCAHTYGETCIGMGAKTLAYQSITVYNSYFKLVLAHCVWCWVRALKTKCYEWHDFKISSGFAKQSVKLRVPFLEWGNKKKMMDKKVRGRDDWTKRLRTWMLERDHPYITSA